MLCLKHSGPKASKAVGLGWVELERVAVPLMSYTRLSERGGIHVTARDVVWGISPER